MSDQTINISGSSNVHLSNIHQYNETGPNPQLQQELSELIRQLATANISPADKANISNKLSEAGNAINDNKPKSVISKILGEAGGVLKELAVATGKTFILSLINS